MESSTQYLYFFVPQSNRFHVWISRLQANAIVLDIKLFQRHLFTVDQRNDGLPVFGCLALIHDNDIAILDVVVDHGMTLHLERISILAHHVGRHLDRFAVFDTIDRLARGDRAQ